MKVRDLLDQLNEVLSSDFEAEVDVVGYTTIKAGRRLIRLTDGLSTDA